jgi:flagellar biosynthesis protein FlhF
MESQTMRIKSYFAGTVEDAMAMGRSELGPDAMLVNSRPTTPDTHHLGEYEVVVATDIATVAAAEAPVGAPLARSLSRRPLGDKLSMDVAGLKKELEGMRRALNRSAFGSSNWRTASPDLTDAYAALAAAEVTPELVQDIVNAAQQRLAGPSVGKENGRQRSANHTDSGALDRSVGEELESRIAADPALGRGEARPRIVALVGPPGSGKTTTLAKLAVSHGLAARRPVLLLSVDTYRIGAAEQLRSFAAILGVGFQPLETVTALAQAIEENRGKELIFIDTPGLTRADLAEFSSLSRFLSTRTDIDTQLVVSSSMKSADLSRVVDDFNVFGPGRLIFTRLDETASCGALLNESVRTGKPVSFMGTGQRIPEDLEPATRSRIADLILGRQEGRDPSRQDVPRESRYRLARESAAHQMDL